MNSSANTQPVQNLPWRLAAPSCVFPAGVAENCAFLAPQYDEIALAFFETEACLAYGEADVPPGLAELPVSWHMHLPLDLPWEQGAARVAEVVLALKARAAHLRPSAFVLHPPQAPGDLAELARLLAARGFFDEPGVPGHRGPASRALLVENIEGRDLARHWPVIEAADLGVCLDLGHMLVHGQEEFLDLPGLFSRTHMLHLNAPDPQKPARHASLSQLDARGRALMARLLGAFAPGGVLVLELFNADALSDSLCVLLAAQGAGGAAQEASA